MLLHGSTCVYRLVSGVSAAVTVSAVSDESNSRLAERVFCLSYLQVRHPKILIL